MDDFSIFIEDYFNSRNMNENVITFDQNAVPDILLNNRFLKLFSENHYAAGITYLKAASDLNAELLPFYEGILPR